MISYHAIYNTTMATFKIISGGQTAGAQKEG
jgi:hypothetical protein